MNVSQKQTARKFVEHWTFRRGSENGSLIGPCQWSRQSRLLPLECFNGRDARYLSQGGAATGETPVVPVSAAKMATFHTAATERGPPVRPRRSAALPERQSIACDWPAFGVWGRAPAVNRLCVSVTPCESSLACGLKARSIRRSVSGALFAILRSSLPSIR